MRSNESGAGCEEGGVSTATVSRVLNGVDVVRNSTRARVVKAVNELRYHPNLHARSLAGGAQSNHRSYCLQSRQSVFPRCLRAVERDCHVQGYEVLVANTSYRPEQLKASIRLMIGRRVAGLAAIVSEIDDEIVQELTESNIPVVFYDVGVQGGNITKIRVNYRRGIERVVEYLVGLGHKHLGFVGHHAVLGPIDERRRALSDTLSRVSPQATIRLAADSDSLEGGQQAARELLNSGAAPTAIICVNDLMAVGVLKELRDQGIRVPEQMSVTGFDNIRLAEYCYPALTTVNIPRDRIGHTVFTSLAPDADTMSTAGKEFVIEPELVVRDSTGPARKTLANGHA